MITFIKNLPNKFKWHIVRPLQKLFTGYSYDMAWDFQHHASRKIYPIFKEYAELPPHGAPTTTILQNEKKQFTKRFSKEKVEAYLAYDGTTEYDEELEKALFDRWSEIHQQVLFSLKFLAIDEETYPDNLYDPNPNYNPEQKEPFHFIPVEGKPEYSELIHHEDYGKTKLNMERRKEFEARVTEGFRLLGIYWRNFWD